MPRLAAQQAGYDDSAPANGASPATQSMVSPESDFDPDFDSQLAGGTNLTVEPDDARAQLLEQLHAGKVDPTRPRLVASYGPQAVVVLDFAHARAYGDALAWQRMHAGRDLPLPASGVALQPEALVRELDLTIWDLGLAAGLHPLHQSPADWWHTPLRSVQMQTMPRYTMLPAHLTMARLIAHGPITPSQLRREAQVGVPELRRFLQASLFLALACWAPGEQTVR